MLYCRRIHVLPLALPPAFLFLFLALVHPFPAVQNLDAALLEALAPLRTPAATRFFNFIAFFGTKTFFFPATAALSAAYYFRYRLKGVLTVLLAMSLSWAMLEGFKNLYHRPRPGLGPLEQAAGFSFPSGHAMMGTVFFGLLALWLSMRLPPRCRLPVILATAVFLILLGFSRLYLGVHYPTDVLAGYAAGLAVLAFIPSWDDAKKTGPPG